MINNTQRFKFLLVGAGIAFSGLVCAQVPNAQTIHETGQQYKEGNPLTGAADNLAIGSQAMFEANLKTKKNIVDMKPASIEELTEVITMRSPGAADSPFL